MSLLEQITPGILIVIVAIICGTIASTITLDKDYFELAITLTVLYGLYRGLNQE